MRVVPRVVVDERGPVGHASNLVAVVPPRHDSRVLGRVLPEPVVCLAEIVQNVATAASTNMGHIFKKIWAQAKIVQKIGVKKELIL